MSELVADCPRCGSKKITFDLTQEHLYAREYDWQYWFEAFCICRNCNRSTIFMLAQDVDSNKDIVHKNGLVKLTGAVNRYMINEGYVALKDIVQEKPPAHLPPQIEGIFKEGATCFSVQCFNAAATMFRLCIDVATIELLPQAEIEGLTSKIKRDLGLRLPWLLKNGSLPEELRELSTCIKDDGNDGAHRGTLGKEDVEDLIDFTYAILERLYTVPEKLRIANERRMARRAKK